MLTMKELYLHPKLSSQNCRAVTSPKKRTDKFVFLSWRLENTWNLNFDFKFKYFRVVRIEKQICPFVFWKKLQLDNFFFKIYWPLVITYVNLIMICKPNTFPTAFATAFEKVHLLQASFLSSLEMLNVEKCEW